MGSRISVALVLAAAFATWVVTGRMLPALAVLFVGGALWVVLRTRAVRRRLDAVRAATQRFDAAALHQTVDAALREPDVRSSVRARLRFHKAVAYLIEENYAEALAVLDGLDAEALGPRDSLAVRGNRAVCRAMLGDAATARELATQCLMDAQAHFPELAPVHEAILGLAELKGGRAQAAADHLEHALAQGVGHPAIETVDAYWLGEAHTALGNADRARQAFERAARVAPDTPFGRRAQARIRPT